MILKNDIIISNISTLVYNQDDEFKEHKIFDKVDELNSFLQTRILESDFAYAIIFKFYNCNETNVDGKLFKKVSSCIIGRTNNMPLNKKETKQIILSSSPDSEIDTCYIFDDFDPNILLY